MNKHPDQQKQVMKHQIYFTAIDAFRKNGYENTSVQRICEMCGIAKGTFYNYFSSKEDIIRESFRNEVDHYLSMKMKAIDSYSSPKEALISFIKTSLEYCEKVGKQTTTLAFVCNLNSAMNNNTNILYEEHYDILKEIILAGRKSDCWKTTLTNDDFISYIVSFNIGLMIYWCYSEIKTTSDVLFEKAILTFVQNL